MRPQQQIVGVIGAPVIAAGVAVGVMRVERALPDQGLFEHAQVRMSQGTAEEVAVEKGKPSQTNDSVRVAILEHAKMHSLTLDQVGEQLGQQRERSVREQSAFLGYRMPASLHINGTAAPVSDAHSARPVALLISSRRRPSPKGRVEGLRGVGRALVQCASASAESSP